MSKGFAVDVLPGMILLGIGAGMAFNPVLLAAMIVGLLINIGQVMTSIQDMTVSTVPRLTAVGVIMFFLTPWMLHHLVTFTTSLLADFRVYTQ